LQLAGFRFFISGLILFIFCGNFKQYFSLLEQHSLFVLWVAFLQTFLVYGFLYIGLNMVPGSLGAIIIGSSPLFAALVAHFFVSDDKMTWKLSIGMFLGVSGIVFINYGRQVTGIAGPKELLGVFFLILTNLAGGAYNVVVMKSEREIPPVMLSSMSLGIGGLALFFVSLPFDGLQLKLFPAEFWVALSWLSILSAVAFAIWFALLKRPGIKISKLNTWKFLIPVVGAILSWWLLPGESPDRYSIIGMVVICSSIVVITFPGFKKNSEKIRLNSVKGSDSIPA
jgi:drug/metabolite transporter (DMT)-like permease